MGDMCDICTKIELQVIVSEPWNVVIAPSDGAAEIFKDDFDIGQHPYIHKLPQMQVMPIRVDPTLHIPVVSCSFLTVQLACVIDAYTQLAASYGT